MQKNREYLIYDRREKKYAILGTGDWQAFRNQATEAFVEAVMDGEIEETLHDDRKLGIRNRRNGYQNPKTVRTSSGLITVKPPRDRAGRHRPKLIRWRTTILKDGFAEAATKLYAVGNSVRDIEGYFKEICGSKVSASSISAMTNNILPKIEEWQQRPLESLYCIVYMDAMHFTVRDNHMQRRKCMYNAIGITMDGRKDLLGMYVSHQESAPFWINVLGDLKKRGVEDILIACIDNLPGFANAIESLFPKTDVQLCVIHQIRTSLQHVSRENKKAFAADLKGIYKADSLAIAERNLAILDGTWGQKYSQVVGSWVKNWDRLSNFFTYPDGIRKMIYSTNTIESFHRQIRKVTKGKKVWPSDMALTKLLYLASMEAQARWVKEVPGWPTIFRDLTEHFPDRVPFFMG